MTWLRCGAVVEICLLAGLGAACAAPPPDGDGEPSLSAGALTTCDAIDDADTTCDGRDDDCDGELDEDCDFGPSDCPAGTHVIAGSAGCDWLWGTSGRDCILGYGGNDVLFGLEGDDVLVGGDGRDMLAGWSGRDQLHGDRGDDTLLGDGGNDTLDGGDGNDALFGGDGEDVMHGGSCQDWLLPSGGADAMSGDDGVDRIESGAYDSVDGGGGKDACSGASCELQGTAARFCVRNSDCPSGLRCVRRSHVCASPSDVPTSDTSCDGYDDDCDGKNDENYAPVVTHCGGGSCGGTGMTACVDGEIVDSCDGGGGSGGSGGGGGSDASCDGADDDCDGQLDEDYVPQAISCGTGACTASGTTACVAGAVVSSCTPGAPTGDDSACNGGDEDCDGAVDEGFVAQPTSCGVGVCSASGTSACVAGSVVDSCTAGSPTGDDSACNGSDEDCDNAVDEGFVSQPTSCGVGACVANGATACVAGGVVDSCTPSTPAASDGSCNGVDDDCNGQVDEDYAPIATSCEAAGCSATGSLVCETGVLHDTCPTAPVCVAELACDDGLDNDGDTLVDCDDSDCDETPACGVQAFSLTVGGTANMWGAGHGVAPGGGALPPGIVLELGAGAIVTFTSVTGSMVHFGATPIPPDGISGTLPLPSVGGIAGYSLPTRQRGMAAVFLGPAEPVDPAPAQLSFPDGEFTSVSPAVGQMFYVGDGRNSASVVQSFVVPAGATRLFLGTTDLCSNVMPGCFDDNSGSYTVTGQVEM